MQLLITLCVHIHVYTHSFVCLMAVAWIPLTGQAVTWLPGGCLDQLMAEIKVFVVISKA